MNHHHHKLLWTLAPKALKILLNIKNAGVGGVHKGWHEGGGACVRREEAGGGTFRRRSALHHAMNNERVTVQGPIKKPPMDYMSHRGGGLVGSGAPKRAPEGVAAARAHAGNNSGCTILRSTHPNSPQNPRKAELQAQDLSSEVFGFSWLPRGFQAVFVKFFFTKWMARWRHGEKSLCFPGDSLRSSSATCSELLSST